MFYDGTFEAFIDVLASPSTAMEATFGRFHNNGTGAEGAPLIVADFTVVGGETKPDCHRMLRDVIEYSDTSKDGLAKTSSVLPPSRCAKN